MNPASFLLQIGDLFAGNFNRRGLIQLIIFILMFAVVIGFGVWICVGVMRSLKK